MSELFSKTIILHTTMQDLKTVFTSNFSNQEKMFINVILDYTDKEQWKFVNSLKINDCISTITNKFKAEFICIYARDKGLDFVFECDYEIFKYVIERECLL